MTLILSPNTIQMKKAFAPYFVLIIFLAISCNQQSTEATILIEETQEEYETRMAWWEDARFGMFIHWGLYAIPAGAWKEDTHHGEWIRNNAQIPLETYDQYISQFNPVKFIFDE